MEVIPPQVPDEYGHQRCAGQIDCNIKSPKKYSEYKILYFTRLSDYKFGHGFFTHLYRHERDVGQEYRTLKEGKRETHDCQAELASTTHTKLSRLCL